MKLHPKGRRPEPVTPQVRGHDAPVPLFGGEFEFVKRRENWASDRVYVFTGDGELLSLPVEWTDLAGEDPFVVVAAGRSPFRTQDLLELAGLLQALSRPGRDAAGVERITP